MKYEQFRDSIAQYLQSHPQGVTWPELKDRLGLPQRTACYTWVYRMEEDVGLLREPSPKGMVWRVPTGKEMASRTPDRTNDARVLGGNLAPFPLPIRTRRMILRAPALSDVEGVRSALDDSEMSQYVPHRPYPYARQDAIDFVRVSRRKMRKGEFLNLIGVDRTSGELRVAVGVHSIDWRDLRGEIGYWVPRKLWGNGFATEAVVAVCKEVFRSLPIRRIEATVLAENIPSARVLTHAGFVKEGTQRQATLRGSSWRDVDLYGLLKDD